MRCMRQRLRQEFPGLGAGKDPDVRQFRMRDRRAGADLRPLQVPRHWTWRRGGRPDLLLRALRKARRYHEAPRSGMTRGRVSVARPFRSETIDASRTSVETFAS